MVGAAEKSSEVETSPAAVAAPACALQGAEARAQTVEAEKTALLNSVTG